MTFISENLQILATLGSALAVYIFLRRGAKKEASELKIEMRAEFKEVKQQIKGMEEKLQILDSRISRIEGQLAPRIYEPQILQKTGE